MLEVAILRVLFLQATNSRTPCSLWIPVSAKRSGRPCKATYHHGRPTTTHWAATGCPSRTRTAPPDAWASLARGLLLGPHSPALPGKPDRAARPAHPMAHHRGV